MRDSKERLRDILEAIDNIERYAIQGKATDFLKIRKMPVITKENRSHSVTGSQKHRDHRNLPYAFTEHDTVMIFRKNLIQISYHSGWK